MKLFLSCIVLFMMFAQLTSGQTLREKIKKEKEAKRTEKYGSLKTFTYLDKKGKLKTSKYRSTRNYRKEFESAAIILFMNPWYARNEGGGATHGGEELYVKRPNEQYPQYIGRYNKFYENKGSSKFRKLATVYFADYPELRKRIESNMKGYRPFQILVIIKEYSDWKSKQ